MNEVVVYQDLDFRVRANPANWRQTLRVDRRVGDDWEEMRGVTDISLEMSAHAFPRLTLKRIGLPSSPGASA